MASFQDSDEEHQRLDWALLQNGPVAMYFDRAVLSEDLHRLVEGAYLVDKFECGAWQTPAEAMADLARQLRFPDYFGGNLDALNDCLGDIEVPDNAGRALVLVTFDKVVERFGEFAWQLLDVIASQGRYHLLHGRRLIGIVQSDDPRLSLAPVGACPVTWNRREWQNKKRGL